MTTAAGKAMPMNKVLRDDPEKFFFESEMFPSFLAVAQTDAESNGHRRVQGFDEERCVDTIAEEPE